MKYWDEKNKRILTEEEFRKSKKAAKKSEKEPEKEPEDEMMDAGK